MRTVSIGNSDTASFTLSHDCGPEEHQAFHRCSISLGVPGFRSEFSCNVRIPDARSFRDQLSRLHRLLSGNAKFASIELEIELDGKISKLGHLTWNGSLTLPNGEDWSTLTFIIRDDQSSLPRIISELDAFIADLEAEGNREDV